MAQKLTTLLFSFVLFFTLVAFPVSAAVTPNASISKAPNNKFVYLTFSGLKNVSRVSYTLVYTTGTRQTGVEGGFRTTTRSSRSVRRQILGTCSTRYCVYHTNAKNIQLQATFYLRTGGTTTVTKTLP